MLLVNMMEQNGGYWIWHLRIYWWLLLGWGAGINKIATHWVKYEEMVSVNRGCSFKEVDCKEIIQLLVEEAAVEAGLKKNFFFTVHLFRESLFTSYGTSIFFSYTFCKNVLALVEGYLIFTKHLLWVYHSNCHNNLMNYQYSFLHIGLADS